MTETIAQSTTGATAGTRTEWVIDPVHSSVEFAIKHMMFTTVKGRFTDVNGTITTDDADPTHSSVSVTIGIASIDTRDEKRDAHLRSPEFFDADTYPTITFKSTRVEPAGDKLKVIGDLTMHGVTREVVLDTTFNGQGVNPWGQQVAGYSAETKFQRRDFGLEWNVALEAGGVLVGEEVKITLDIEAAKQA